MELFSGLKSLKTSTTTESTMYSELSITGLVSGFEYRLRLNSKARSMHEYLWAEECRVVTLSAQSINSDDLEQTCISDPKNYNQAPITLNANDESKLTLRHHESQTL